MVSPAKAHNRHSREGDPLHNRRSREGGNPSPPLDSGPNAGGSSPIFIPLFGLRKAMVSPAKADLCTTVIPARETLCITVIPAQAGIQGWGPQLGNLRISTTFVSRNGSYAKVSSHGNAEDDVPDLIVRNGNLIDGTGAPARDADLVDRRRRDRPRRRRVRDRGRADHRRARQDGLPRLHRHPQPLRLPAVRRRPCPERRPAGADHPGYRELRPRPGSRRPTGSLRSR